MRYQADSEPAARERATLRHALRPFALCVWAALLPACSGSAAESNAGQGGSAPSAGGTAGARTIPAAGSGGTATSAGGAFSGGAGPASSGGNGAEPPSPTAGGNAGSVGGSTTAGVASASGGSGTVGAGAGGTSPGAGANAGSTSGGTSAAGRGGAGHMDHCVSGYEPDPADATMKDGPVEYVKSDQVDLIVQPEVMAFMTARKWQAAHFEWHSIRRCNGGFSQSRIDICKFTDMIPADQECKSDGDGYQFLVVHRHMIQALKQRFPSHLEQFTGFPRFPQAAEDLPQQWRDSWTAFSAQTVANGKIADEIDKPENLSRFASEGAFGRWIQCFAPQSSGLHADLHFKWVRSRNTEHGLGNQETNLDNYLFWKMHGWIDDVWEKYRKAKGLNAEDPKLKQDLIAQCREMDAIAQIIDPNLKPDPMEEPVLPEAGVFHEMVRPIFENDIARCSGCHGPQGAEAGLTLGGIGISSAKIVAALVNKPATHGGQFKLVVPGQPEQSWLYLKAAGKAAAAGCSPTAASSCNGQVMPPSGSGEVTLTNSELETLRRWIADGAQPPTNP